MNLDLTAKLPSLPEQEMDLEKLTLSFLEAEELKLLLMTLVNQLKVKLMEVETQQILLSMRSKRQEERLLLTTTLLSLEKRLLRPLLMLLEP